MDNEHITGATVCIMHLYYFNVKFNLNIYFFIKFLLL